MMRDYQLHDTSVAASTPTSEPQRSHIGSQQPPGVTTTPTQRTPTQLAVAAQLGLLDPYDDDYWDLIKSATSDSRSDAQLLQRLGQLITRRGYAGDVRPVMLTYLMITSRLLKRPMNLNITGESSSGKNATAEAAIALHPVGAVLQFSAASPAAMIFTKESLVHRIAFFMEADSIPETGPAGSAIRAIAADNEMTYSTVGRNPETNRNETYTVKKEGPTGLLTTTTGTLDPQMATRMLELPLVDDPIQTRAVMNAHVAKVNEEDFQTTDMELLEFIALQEYIIARGEWRVYIPYADALSNLISPTATRLRRDFRQLLTCIQTVALLHQWQRPRTSDGRIEASLDDYFDAWVLLVPLFNMVAADGVTSAIRETVNAVGDETDVSEASLTIRLSRSKSAIHYRVKRCIVGGWLVNDEPDKGFPAKLRRGAPLPDATTSALPTVDHLRAEWERTR